MDYDEQDTADVGWEDDAYDAWLSERLGEPTPPVSADAAYEVAQAAGRDADRGGEPPERLDADRGPVVLYDQFAGVHSIEGARLGREAADTPEFEYRVEARRNNSPSWDTGFEPATRSESNAHWSLDFWRNHKDPYWSRHEFRMVRRPVAAAWEVVA